MSRQILLLAQAKAGTERVMHGREKGGPLFSRRGASFFTCFMGSGQDWFGFFLRSRRTAAMEKNITTGISIITRAAVVILGWYVSMLI